jgi:ABC-2 type transport system ATP-binding protein
MTVLTRRGLVPEEAAAQPDGQVVTAALDSADGNAASGSTASGSTAPGNMAPGNTAPEDIVAALVQAGVRVRGFAVERESLEDRFVALTGEGFDVAQ